ncbi:MAG TPA: VOC family protein, partial [Gemmatimonadales bacterium]|nr:VOC family protein [Gemmatimonadales bacterium]
VARSLGVRPAFGGQHIGRGTRNFLLALGPGHYLEIIGPDPDQPAPAGARPFGIDQLERPALRAWLAKSSQLEQDAATAAALGFDLGEIHDMTRTTPDGEVLRWRLTLPAMPGVAIVPFLIDWGGTRHPSTTAPGGVSLVRFKAEHPDPKPVKAVLKALGLALALSGGPAPRLRARIDGPAGSLELA